MRPEQNFYSSLGLDRTASVDQCVHTLKRLKPRYHPDHNRTPEGAKAYHYILYIEHVFKRKRTRYNKLVFKPVPAPAHGGSLLNEEAMDLYLSGKAYTYQ